MRVSKLKVDLADISVEQRDLILHKNAKKILNTKLYFCFFPSKYFYF